MEFLYGGDEMSEMLEKNKKNYYIATGASDESELIPLISDEDEDTILNTEIPDTLPILPLRNTVLFPGVILPISVGRNKSLKLIREIYKDNKIIGTVSQIDPDIDEPGKNDINAIGTVAQILKILEMPDGTTSVIIQGKKRFQIDEIISEDPYITAKITALEEIKPKGKDSEYEAIVGSLKDLSLRIIKLSSNIPPEASFAVKNIESSTFLINFICSNSDVEVDDKQKLLCISSLKKRGIALLEHLVKEVQLLELKNDIQSKVKVDIDQQQREYMLHQQMKTIQNELGGNPIEQEVIDLKEAGKKKKWSKEIHESFDKETEKLIRLNPASGEYSVQLNYVQTLLELPWNEYTKDNFNLKRAKKILDQDHYGLDEVKDRIIEHLAVLKLKGDLKSPILCLVGPPGVGKTSLGKSVAKALNRKYVRMSLGGLRDEAEIRGHRKTYIGAMPGRILHNLKKVKSSNPVFMLDEIDKMSRDSHSDPSSAMLEVLDPEQNNNFHDNFIELDYDLSKVMFIATANTISSIHPALLDRMELINISGYVIDEKNEIAKRHLIPKNITDHGLKKSDYSISKQNLDFLIENYTRESGVRQLDKTLAKVSRVIAKKVAMEETYEVNLSTDNLIEILGKPKYQRDKYQGNDYAGVVTGLAWTSVGGDILYIETSLSKGKGKLTLTGNLGDVMKESAVIALEYLKAHNQLIGLKPEVFDNWNVHIHVPEGAIPKDGPSAGVTMITSLVSAFTQRKVKKNIAMTGEITLRGKVLPVGGIKEKILAAKRAGIKEIFLSIENKRDIEEINELYLKGVSFHYIENVEELIKQAVLKQKIDNPLTIQ